ncbi:MAG TPA: hypothetical protein PK468_24995 [Candidatus Hydrogenedentes bacterium]|nr:hypothetical protein [Candidatus Hydrogenedentota bacterium]
MVADIRYWDVFPKSICGFRTPNGGQDMTVQLVLCGDPPGVIFESDDTSIATLTGAGVVTLGMKVGCTTIRVFEPARPENTRKVDVQIIPCPGTDIHTVGLANAPGEDTGRYALEGHVHENNLKPGSAIQPVGLANSPGTQDALFTRVDHIHKGLTQFGTNIQSVGAANSPGTLDQAARADHIHKAPQPGSNIQSTALANSPGASDDRFAREDHVHKGTQAGTNIQTVGASNAAGTSEKFAREDHVHKTVWLEYHGT